MIRYFILKNKSKVAIILSVFLHSLLLFSIQSDESLGTTKTPIEYTEIKIIAGMGESIRKSNLNQVKKEETQKKIKQQMQSKNNRNLTSSNSEIPIESKTKKDNIKNKENQKNIIKKAINKSSKVKKSSTIGNKSTNKKNEHQRGRLKGRGTKAIICKKCKDPIYSQKSIRKGLEGITTVEVTIDTNGLVIDAKIIDSSGHKDIDNASISAAIKSTFQPISEKSIIKILYKHKIK